MLRPAYPLETARHSEIFKGAWGDELVDAVLEDEWRERVSGGRPG